MDGIWLQKFADWAWTLIVGVAFGLFRLFQRVNSNSDRLDALEKREGAVAEKIDSNQQTIMQSIEALRKEMRDDYRMVVANLLERVPRA